MNSKIVRTELSTSQINRRHFIYTSTLAATVLAASLPACASRPKYKSPNEKLNIGGIGTAGKARWISKVFLARTLSPSATWMRNNLAAAKQKIPGRATLFRLPRHARKGKKY